jgi:putative transposase
MQTYETLKHTTWDCRHHVVFIPKCRRKVLYQGLRRELGEVFRSLAEHWECKVEEGHLMPDHVHMLLMIPPKYAVSQVTGFIKGKSAIHIARVYSGRRRNFYRPALLGAGILGVDRRQERGCRAGVYPEPGKGRPTPRTTGVEGALSGSRYLKPPALPEVADG